MTHTGAAVSISFGPGFTHDLGKPCGTCRIRAATCALRGGCCGGCSHFRHLDADGNDKPKPEAVVIVLDTRPTCETCGRKVTRRGRYDCPGACTDARRQYDRERARRQARAS